MQFQFLPGLTPYSDALELQRELVVRREQNLVEDTVLFLEHEPVITQGRGLQFPSQVRHMPVDPGVKIIQTQRGGDLTWHGPGQLVVYPIFKLDGKGFAPWHDVGGFLRKLERVCSELFLSLGLAAETRPNATGVWVDGKKAVSIGIAVKKWVTYHGIAINVCNDLSGFRSISPCGFDPEVMSTLERLWPSLPKNWRPWLEKKCVEKFLELNAVVN